MKDDLFGRRRKWVFKRFPLIREIRVIRGQMSTILAL
jgi:hypothetical protein